MKKITKILTALLPLLLILTMGFGAQAADPTYGITINNSDTGHTYEAYQVFSGTLSGTGVLSNIGWGSGVNSAALLTALKSDSVVGSRFTACVTAADVATVMNGLTNDSADTKAIAQIIGANLSATVAGTSTAGTGSYTITGLSAGYYLVKDKNASQNNTYDAYTRFMLEVVKDITVTPKNDVPSVTKKVTDVNDSTGVKTGWQDSADYDIGDLVPFRLAGTLPTNYSDYTKYKYVFHDTMAAGLTFDPSTVKVYVDTTLISTGYTIVTTGLTDGCTFEVRFTDLKTIAAVTKDSVIAVEYSARLNANAVIGSVGNPNKVSLEYSNNPNAGGEGDTGKTPDDNVIVFTYKTVINKVDQNNNPLSGATFLLEKYNAATLTYTAVAVTTNTEGTVFTFTGLDDGLYRLTETATPVGYNSVDPIYFTVAATHDVTADIPTLLTLTANQSDDKGTNLTAGIIATFVASPTSGNISTNIVNNSGSKLPSTGGVGTTIFYVVGGILIVGAAVLLVRRIKMSGNKR